ncbi:hypothetical protein D3C73_1581460 [compost metagenome]
MLTEPGDRLQRAFPFRGKCYLPDQSRIQGFPLLQPFNISGNNMLGVLRSGPLGTDKRAFQMDTCQLGEGHRGGAESVNL